MSKAELIPDLKRTRAKFKNLSIPEREVLVRAKKGNCELLGDDGVWTDAHEDGYTEVFRNDYRYRLNSDYTEPEAEVVEPSLKGMQGCAWEDVHVDPPAAIRELQDACDLIIDAVQALIESKP